MEGRHKKVQVVLAAPNGAGEWHFLIFKTNKDRGRFWQNVTGSVEGKETFEEAALREAQEESALPLEAIVDIRDLALVFTFTDRWKRKVEERAFLIVGDRQWEPTLDSKEHESCRWVSLRELAQGLVEWPSNLEALNKAARILRRMAA